LGGFGTACCDVSNCITHSIGNKPFLAAAITKTIVTNIAMGLIAQMFVAYAVSYAVTYIATGSAKATQSAGLSAVLFMGIGGLREGKMGANGKMLNVLMSQGKSRVNLIRNQRQNYRPFCLARCHLLIHERLRFS
jgi:hypothetical protein